MRGIGSVRETLAEGYEDGVGNTTGGSDGKWKMSASLSRQVQQARVGTGLRMLIIKFCRAFTL